MGSFLRLRAEKKSCHFLQKLIKNNSISVNHLSCHWKCRCRRLVPLIMPSLLENINAPSSAYSERKNWKIVPVLWVGWPVMVPLMEPSSLSGSQLKLEASLLCSLQTASRVYIAAYMMKRNRIGARLSPALRQQEKGKHACSCELDYNINLMVASSNPLACIYVVLNDIHVM